MNDSDPFADAPSGVPGKEIESRAHARFSSAAVVKAKPLERLAYIVDLMKTGKWSRGITHVAVAAHFGISESTAAQDAAEAWRIICREANNPTAMQPEIAGILRTNLIKADAMYDGKDKFNSIAKLADTYSKVVGARAPEKHEHAHTVEQFDQLDLAGKVNWLNERIDRLTTARDKLLSEAGAIPVIDVQVEAADE